MKDKLSEKFEALLKFVTPVRVIVFVAALAFFWFVVLGDKGIYQLRRLIEMKNRLTTERQTLNDDIDGLSEEKHILQDPANLEPAARSELGYIRPGEVVFEEKKN